MIETENLRIAYGGVVALKDVTVRLEHSVSGLIGPNGAGKTTFLNALSGFAIPKAGRIRLDGEDITVMAPHQRARWGLRRSFQKEDIVDGLTIAENVAIQLDTCGIGGAEREREIDRVLEFAGLSGQGRRLTEDLSSLQRRMTEIARCLAGEPRVVLLDEPGAGFSQSEIDRLKELILSIADFCGAQTLLIDHDVDLIRATCTETMVLDFGNLVVSGPTDEILEVDEVKSVYLGVEAIE